MEYAVGFQKLGHEVSITTYPDTFWEGSNPFPWFKFDGTIHYKRLRSAEGESSSLSPDSVRLLGSTDFPRLAQAILGNFGFFGLREVVLQSAPGLPDRTSIDALLTEMMAWMYTMETIPDCDLNIATLWSTAFAVYFSGKGKPVYFMQHYEEVFYPLEPGLLVQRLLSRMSYSLPTYKVANSSWLQKQIETRFGQKVPFSNNGLHLSDFRPREKASVLDGVIRVFTYSRPDDWKGFGDAVAAMAKVRQRYGGRVEWNVFGYKHLSLGEDNQYAPYRYHPKLSFSELGQLYATSDIALCPSWYESFPLPPLEAMASRTAVVTTQYGTEDYAFDGRNALVVGSRDVEGMYNAVSRLVEDDDLRERLAAAGYETAKTFNWDRAIKDREAILLNIHSGKPGYDVMASARLGLYDAAGIPFEGAPADLAVGETAFCSCDGHLFLIHNGSKRHITNPAVIPAMLKHPLRWIDVDTLTMARVPLGFPISSASDLPDLSGARETDSSSGTA